MENSKKRLEYIDVAKGIAIICIILGHLGIHAINRVVFTFHVPIFFLITGFFINANTSVFDFTKKKIRTLIVPYYVTCIFMILFGIIDGIVGGYAKTASFMWTYASLYGAGDNYTEPFFIKGIGAIWFLWASFWASLFLRISLNFSKWCRVIWVFLLFIIGYESRRWFWFPLSIQAGACATFFMYIGYLTHKAKEHLKQIPSEAKLFCCIFALWTWISFIHQFQSFWFVHCDVGRGIIDIFGSLCACACVILFSWFLDQKCRYIAKPLSFIGKYSIFVLCIHILELNLFPWGIVSKIASPQYELLVTVCGKLLLDLGGTWCLAHIPLVRKLFGMK